MARKEKTIHYIYKTTCKVTNRYYIGMHSTSNIDDGYMGSGLRLRRSIRKHGVNNHIKEILEYCINANELSKREKEIVTFELIADDLCMNLVAGGYGGFISKEGCSKGGKAFGLKHSYSEIGKKGGASKFKKHGPEPNFKCDWNGRVHSNETKQLMSEIRKGNGVGKENSQYGTCWITKKGKNKKVKIEDLESWFKNGWAKGRS